MPLPAHALVCVDFDDTLVVNQRHFDHAVRELAQVLHAACGVDEAEARRAFEAVDARYHHQGRHRNRFLLTVLAAFCEVTGTDAVPMEALPRLAAISAYPYDARPDPVPGGAKALERLRAAHRGPLWLVTAGDAVVQSGRIQRSGLAGPFDAIHIVPDKTAAVFAALGHGHAQRWMIGNSPRTDILPALEAGFSPLYVDVGTWRLDLAPVPDHVPRFASFAAAVEHLLGERGR